MTEEQWQRKMEFIIEQEARITAHVEELQEYRKRNQPQWEAFQRSFVQLVELTRIMDERMDSGDFRVTTLETRSSALETRSAALDASMTDVAKAHTHLAETQAHLAETQAHLAKAQAHLAEAQAHADERVSALIDWIIDNRNGPS